MTVTTPLFAQLAGPTYWLPQQASDVSEAVDAHFYFIYWINVFFFVGISAVMVYFILKYRRRTPNQEPLPSPAHNTVLELTWSIVPTIVVIGLFYVGFVTYVELMNPPKETFKVNVLGKRWFWTFTYPKTGLVGADDNDLAELHVPANVPVELTMTSEDVIHCLYIPALRTKKDVVPGRYSKLWFNCKIPDTYNIFCAEYCGTGHSEMYARLVVHKDMKEFEEWEKQRQQKIQNLPPVELGKYVYKTKGCVSCHSIDGKAGTGPTWVGLWGDKNHHVYKPSTGGTTPIVVDENYIRTSIEAPNADVRAEATGFPFGKQSVMPSFEGRLSPKEMTGIIEFIKTMEKGPYQDPSKKQQ